MAILTCVPRETVPADAYRLSGRFRVDGDRLDARIARLAGTQHGVVSRHQLRDLGLGARGIDHRIQAGRLHRLHQGVYAVGHRVLVAEAWWTAAVLASGPGAVLSHRSAAELWGLRSYREGAVDVTVPRKSSSSREIRRHVSTIPVDERTVKRGNPVTSVPRTILDLAATTSTDRIESIVREAEYRRLYDALSLHDIVIRYPRRRGVRRLRSALQRLETGPSGRVRVGLEERFGPFLRRHDLPQPRFNQWILVAGRRFQVDGHWPGSGQIVELDGWEGHGTRSAFRDDRARDRLLRVAGYSVTRLTWAQLDDEPEAVAADLRALLGQD